DRTVRLWDLATQTDRILGRHSGAVVALDCLPDGRHLLAHSDDQTVRMWDLAGFTSELFTDPNGIEDEALSSDGQFLALSDAHGTIRLTDRTHASTRLLSGHEASTWSMRFSPDNRLLASASSDQTIRIWEVASGACRSILRGHEREVISI